MAALSRNLQQKINELLSVFPVVLILGARQVGKTTLAQMCRPKWKYFDLEKGSDYDFITQDFDFFFKEYPKEIIMDEAQTCPQLFRELRGVIDNNRTQKNRFILTGSSSPEMLHHISDSLSGRVGIIELGTLKFNEVEEKSASPLYKMLQQPLSSRTIEELKELPATTGDFLNHLLKGGYPEPVQFEKDSHYYAWMENYYKTYISRDIRQLFPRLDIIKYRRFISMLANLSGTIINKAQIGRSIDVSEVSIRDYLQIAHDTYIWRTIPSYEISAIKSVVKMPKGIFRDSGLLHYLNNITSREQMIRSPHIGQNFESSVIEEILKGMNQTSIPKWDYYYYRTRNGAEIDLVLEGSFGILPIEVKFSTNTQLKQLRSLDKFINDNNLPVGIVINNADECRKISERIVQLPVQCV